MEAINIYTIKDAAAALQMGEDAVLAEIKDGKLAASNVSRGSKKPRWRLLEADIVNYLHGLRGDAPAPSAAKKAAPVKTKSFI